MQNVPRQQFGLCACSESGHQDGELISAEARERVLSAHGALQPVAHFFQKKVADAVAESVIDWLETVEIQQQHRHLRLLGPRHGNRVLKSRFEHRAVGETGERIMPGSERLPAECGATRCGSERRSGKSPDSPESGNPVSRYQGRSTAKLSIHAAGMGSAGIANATGRNNCQPSRSRAAFRIAHSIAIDPEYFKQP